MTHPCHPEECLAILPYASLVGGPNSWEQDCIAQPLALTARGRKEGASISFSFQSGGIGFCLPLRPPLIEDFSKGGGTLILNYPQNKSNRESHAFVDLLQSLFQSHLKTHSPKNHTSAEKELRHLLQVFMVLSASCLPGGLCGTSDHFFNSLPLLHLYVLVAKQREELEHPPFQGKRIPLEELSLPN